MEKLCVIKIRSDIRANGKQKEIFSILDLRKQNNCAIFDKTDSILGLLKEVEGYVTYGEVDAESLKKLLKKKTTIDEQKLDQFVKDFFDSKAKLSDLGIRNRFSLHPPRKGFERKGKKVPYKLGGAAGYRGKDINELLLRMI